MKPTLTLLTALLVAPLTALHAQTPKPEAGGGFATASPLEEFLGEPLLVPIQQIWEKRGGWGGILTAKVGTVVAFSRPEGPPAGAVGTVAGRPTRVR